MGAVFKRYPFGGGELLLALALADHAHDDGTHIYPGIPLLMVKTRQSERSVQSQLRKMLKIGFLIKVADSRGGKGNYSEYKINPEWLNGAELAPLETDQSELATVQSATLTVQPAVSNGATSGIAYKEEPSLTIIQPSEAAQQVARPIADTHAKQVPKIGWDVPDKMFKGITAERMQAWERAFPGFDVEGELTRIDLWYERRLRESPKFRWKNAERGIHNWLSRAYTDSKKPKVFVKPQPPAQPAR